MNDSIKISSLKKVLKELQADSATTQLVINTAKLYNSLLEKFLAGEKIHPYMLTGTNGQVFNQLLALKKLQKKEPKNEDDSFTQFMSGFKNKSMKNN